MSIASLTYSERGNDLLILQAPDQPLIFSIALTISHICLLPHSAVPLCFWEKGKDYRHDFALICYFVSLGILYIFKYNFSFYRIKYFSFKSLVKHIFCCRLANNHNTELTSDTIKTPLREESAGMI